MLREFRFRGEVIVSSVMFFALLLSLALLGCGGDDGSNAAMSGPSVEQRSPAAVTLPPPPPVETPLVVEGPEITTPPEAPREVTFDEAEAAYFERRYEEAARLFTLYSERRPQNPWGYYMLGLSAWKAGEHERAEEAFAVALELDPGHVKSWLNLSRVLLDTGRPEEALGRIEEALTRDPESGVGARLKGRAYHQLGRLEEAIDAYRQAILIDDRDAWAMNNLGLILIEQESFSEALPPLARAAELRDDVAIFQNNLGVALERTGHFRAAEDAYQAAVALDVLHEKADANLRRVELLEEDLETEPVDLANLARSFVDEVEGWREAVAYQVPLEVVPSDSIGEASQSDSVTAEPDQTVGGETEKATREEAGSGVPPRF